MIVVPDGLGTTRSAEDPRQQLFPLEEDNLPQVLSAVVQQVEYEVDDLLIVPAFQQVLKGLEVGCPVLPERGDLAVEDHVLQPEFFHGTANRRKTVRPIVPATREERCRTISNDTDHPVAVELQLVQPPRIVGKLNHKVWKLGGDPVRHWRPPGPAQP